MPAMPKLSDALKGVKNASQSLINTAYSAVAPVAIPEKADALQKIDPSLSKPEIPFDLHEYFVRGDPTHPQ